MDLTTKVEAFTQEDQSWLGSARGTQTPQTISLLMSGFTANTHYPNGYFPSGLPLAKLTSGSNAGSYVPCALRPNEGQTVTITGTPTGGTFTLTLDGETTAAIAYNAAASAVKTALEGLSNVSVGDVVVSGGPGPGTPYVVTFSGGTWAGKDVPAMTATGSFTGGSSPAVAVTTSTAGGSGVTDGTDQLAGFLFTSIKAPATAAVAVGSLLETGRVIVAKLPIAVTANQQATNPRFVYA